jgi:hypothetical protein
LIWLSFVLAVAQAKPLACEFGRELNVGKFVYKNCEITGHSGVTPTYYAHCDSQPEDRQLEFAKGESQAHWINPLTRKEFALCTLKTKDIEAMTGEYAARTAVIEKPPCYLTNWKGQLTLVAHGKPYRCSFKMLGAALAEFERETGKKGAFQCEGGHFLATVGSDTTYAYEGSKFLCQPSKRIGEPPEAIDWKNPPDFYDPELEILRPRSGSP